MRSDAEPLGAAEKMTAPAMPEEGRQTGGKTARDLTYGRNIP